MTKFSLVLVSLFTILSTNLFSQENEMVRINYSNFKTFDQVMGVCVADSEVSYSVTHQVTFTKNNGEIYTYSQKEVGYGECGYANQIAEKNSNELADKIFSVLWGDLEVLPVGNQSACYRSVINLVLLPNTKEVKSLSFKKLPYKCP